MHEANEKTHARACAHTHTHTHTHAHTPKRVEEVRHNVTINPTPRTVVYNQKEA